MFSGWRRPTTFARRLMEHRRDGPGMSPIFCSGSGFLAEKMNRGVRKSWCVRNRIRVVFGYAYLI